MAICQQTLLSNTKATYKLSTISTIKNPKKPARIPPQTPPPRGQNAKKSAEVLPNPFPQKIVLAKPSQHFAPPHCPETSWAEPQKEKCPFHFRKNLPPRKTKEQGTFFLFGVAE